MESFFPLWLFLTSPGRRVGLYEGKVLSSQGLQHPHFDFLDYERRLLPLIGPSATGSQSGVSVCGNARWGDFCLSPAVVGYELVSSFVEWVMWVIDLLPWLVLLVNHSKPDYLTKSLGWPQIHLVWFLICSSVLCLLWLVPVLYQKGSFQLTDASTGTQTLAMERLEHLFYAGCPLPGELSLYLYSAVLKTEFSNVCVHMGGKRELKP